MDAAETHGQMSPQRLNVESTCTRQVKAHVTKFYVVVLKGLLITVKLQKRLMVSGPMPKLQVWYVPGGSVHVVSSEDNAKQKYALLLCKREQIIKH